MTYAVIYASKTGNTELLANHIREALGEEGCLYCGPADAVPAAALTADLLFVGTWTDKGNAAEEVRELLGALRGAHVFLFGTCGFGGSQAYFDQVMDRMLADLDDSCELAGTFMCQGKMPAGVRARYEAMLAAAAFGSEDADRAQMFLENFDAAVCHPNAEDLTALERAVGATLG